MLVPMRLLLPSVVLIVVLLFVLIGVPYFFHTPSSPVRGTSDFPADFSFEIASTTEARTLGLSGRMRVDDNYGMLFVFDAPGSYGFWMKDMFVPIDIIWISKEKQVLGIEENISPDTFPTLYYPPVSAQYVLETKAGEARRLGLATGSHIWLPL